MKEYNRKVWKAQKKVRRTVKKILNQLGYDVRKKEPFGKGKKIIECSKSPRIDNKIVDEIFKFFEACPPFYDESIRAELQIGGCWKTDFENRRQNQLKYLRSNDKNAYANLLNSMLKNELIAGQWFVEYYQPNVIGKPVPEEFSYALRFFEGITRLPLSVLDDGDFGGKWGVNVGGGHVLTFVDPYKGVNAFNTSRLINHFGQSKGCYIDLGSGFGSDAIKVEKMSNFPIRAILIDLPLNLTSAYAYVAMNTGKKCILIKDEQDLEFLKEQDFDESHFVFLPTKFVESFCKLGLAVDVLYNHGSFSEMDYHTVEFYLNQFLNGKLKALLEINSNVAEKHAASGHTEIPSTKFPIPKGYNLVKRNVSILNYFKSQQRYLESLYVVE